MFSTHYLVPVGLLKKFVKTGNTIADKMSYNQDDSVAPKGLLSVLFIVGTFINCGFGEIIFLVISKVAPIIPMEQFK